ncbi:hypothetical protein [Clostridium grantii]|uniref:Uncharacterized protein n=1 Tax=Clostridium grantii DSM 8605 TaxID=1121316 RepID=A0A1M5V2Z2_9CLOT|nr:hypothetical protein [Clostridium grantii]SHH69637.1 hypothetical protein SAMN02745207_02036 [Clostridium grantii DSM 8605]
MIKYDEKTYKAVKVAGAANIAIGTITIVMGVTLGVISIVCGSNLLSKKKNLID